MSNPSFSRGAFAPAHVEAGTISVSAIVGLGIAVLIAAGVTVIASRANARLSGQELRPNVTPLFPQVNASTSANRTSQSDHSRAAANYAALPLAFDPNVGQSNPRVKYLARGRGYSLFLTANSAYFAIPALTHSLRAARSERELKLSAVIRNHKEPGSTAVTDRDGRDPVASIQMEMLGSNRAPQIIAENQLPGVTNYILGRNSENWHSGVAHFGQVRYRNVYPGVDLAYHGASQRDEKFEFDFLLNPGAKPQDIKLRFRGAQKLRTSASGDLVLASETGDLHLHRPFAYQETNGVRQPVDARFVIQANDRVSFALGNYDRSRQVVIDPTVTYSTYLGGSLEDDANAIAVDASGNTYITGETDSIDFPGAANAPVGTFDVFVTKLSSSGALVFTTLVGGSLEDIGNAIVVDGTGIYVAGRTSSPDFPIKNGPQQTFLTGTNHGFLFKLACTGSTCTGSSLSYSTFIEGSVGDSALGLAVDANQEAYVVGDTVSLDLGSNSGGNGTINPLQIGSNNGGSLNNGTLGTNDDGFIAKLSNDGTTYLFLSYLGGSNIDIAEGAAIDMAGNVYVAGLTISSDFPATAGVFQTKCGTDGTCNTSGGNVFDDAFVTAISAGNAPTCTYSTYFGGENKDDAFAIAVDSNKNAYITGQTFSASLPTKNPLTGLSSLAAGTQKAFVASLNPTGTALNYSTYLGGSGNEAGDGIAVDTVGNAYVTGNTTSSDFPTVSATQATFAGGSSTGFGTDAFVSELHLNGTSLSFPFSTYLGGTGDEDFVFGAIAVDALGKIYVTGVTNSSDFPLKASADSTYNGGNSANCALVGGGGTVPCPDAFVTAYAPNADFSIAGTALSPVNPGSSSSSTITVTPFHSYSNTVNLTCTVGGGGTPAPTCSFSSASISGGSGTSMLTVSTTAATALLQTPGPRRSTIFYASLFPVAGLALIGLAAYPAKGKRLAAFLGLLALLTFLLLLPACGGGSSNTGGGGGGGGNPGTPAGNYTITVTGADGTITHSIAPPLTLTVN